MGGRLPIFGSESPDTTGWVEPDVELGKLSNTYYSTYPVVGFV